MKLRIAILLLATSTLAFSQTTKATDHKPAEKKSAAPSAAMPAMPTVSEEQAKLAKIFKGSWTVTGKTEAGPNGPAETATGTEKNIIGPGKFSLLTDTNMKFSRMGPFQGHGVMYWDPETKNYTGTWCDNLGPCATQGIGQWEGDNLVFNSEMKMGGQTSKMRQTYSKITPNSFRFTMEMGDPSGALQPWMTLDFKRAGAAAPAAAEAAKK
jgi:hypothetical protein